jgi:hypothetical protein
MAVSGGIQRPAVVVSTKKVSRWQTLRLNDGREMAPVTKKALEGYVRLVAKSGTVSQTQG